MLGAAAVGKERAEASLRIPLQQGTLVRIRAEAGQQDFRWSRQADHGARCLHRGAVIRVEQRPTA